MKRIVLIMALTIGLITQQTQCWNWKYMVAGTGVLVTAGLACAYYMGWFNADNKEPKKDNTENKTDNTENKKDNTENKTDNTENKTDNTENKTDNTENKTDNTENKTDNTENKKIDKNGNNDLILNNVQNNKNFEGKNNDTKTEDINHKPENNNNQVTVSTKSAEDWANELENLMTNPNNKKNSNENINEFSNKVDDLKKSNDKTLISQVLNFKFKNNQNLYEKATSKQCLLSGANTVIENLYKKYAPNLLPKKEITINKNKTDNFQENTNKSLGKNIQRRLNELKNN